MLTLVTYTLKFNCTQVESLLRRVVPEPSKGLNVLLFLSASAELLLNRTFRKN